ncbi:MAG: hypothetical protein M0R75_01665 [Dehalococcoidia bacterium]|nr:hypothetical protein [Dehalococcoidia bacterium]
MSGWRPKLREPNNVAEALERDDLVSRGLAIRRRAEAMKADIEHWNRTHSDQAPLSTAFEDAIIAWCDGLGPLPEMPAAEGES